MATKKKENFEKLFNEIQKSVEDLEQNKFSIDESLKEYEGAMRKIVTARKMIDKMEAKITEISAS